MKLSILSLILFSSCSLFGTKYSNQKKSFPKDKALLTIYRPWRFAGSVIDPYTCLNNKVVGEFYNGKYYQLILKPGKYHVDHAALFDGPSGNGVYFEAKSGEQYFLRFEASQIVGVDPAASGRPPIVSLLNPMRDLKELEKISDQRVQKKINNPGLMFVKESYALSELKDIERYEKKKFNSTACNAN
jgi:hypothetical protein